MPSVDELLNVAEVIATGLTETNDKIEIDADTRTMMIPETERVFGVMSDEKGERKYFRCKRFVGNGIDLSKLSLRIVFQNASGLDTGRDKYIVTDLATDGEDYVTFSWELSRKVTAYKGIISFVVCAIKTNSDGTITNEWNTTLANGIVLDGLEVSGTQEQEKEAYDYYKQLEAELEKKAQEVIGTIPSDYTALEENVDGLKEDVGQYKQTFTMSNQYLSTFTIQYTPKFYFRLLSHPIATFSGCRIYGVNNGVETELTSQTFIHKEFYWTVPTVYTTIKITVGFGQRVSGDVNVILVGVNETNISSKTLDSALSLNDLIKSVSPNLCGDLYKDVQLIPNKNIISDFTKCSVNDYLDYTQSTTNGSISERAIKIRDDYGRLFANIYFIVPKERDNDIMCWTFDNNGNALNGITGVHLNDGFSSEVYYIVLVNFFNVETVKALYNADKEYIFEVGSEKPYKGVTDCLSAISHIPYKKKVLIYSGTYDIYSEIGGDNFANNIPNGTNWRTVSVVAENNTHIVGVGNVHLTMNPTNINTNAASLLSPLNISGNVIVENINIICSNCRYGIHIEGSNIAEYNDTTCVLKNVNILRNLAVGSAQSNGPAIGVGMNQRSMLIFEDCYINAKGGWAGLYYHENSSTEEYSPALRIFNSIFTITSGYALALSASANQTTMIDTYIVSSYVKSLRKMTGGSSAFNDAYKIVMLNCNMPTISASDLMENEIDIEHYNTIA